MHNLDTTAPCIYVACLAAYNNGKLHGRWIDATRSPNEIMERVQEMLEDSPEPNAKEWMIHNYAGFDGVKIDQFESFERVNQLAEFAEEHGSLGAMLLPHFDDDIDVTEEAINNSYCGEYTSPAVFAEQITEESTDLPNYVSHYIDYDKMARDMEISGDILTLRGAYNEVHVFWNQ